MEQKLEFSRDLIQRYDTAGPRYTSYPTAVQFHDGFTELDYKACAAASNQTDKPRPLSLYFHIPFCDTVCYYCACNKVVTKDRSRAAPYLQRLHNEIRMQAELFDDRRVIDQLHWGGGTPTFISHDEMRELMQVTRKHFKLHDDDKGEYSIEIDPREVSADTISLLRDIGFNRMSLGVQDFNPRVQKAVNRIQTEEETFAAIDTARQQGFKSISLDLIYGLPYQTMESFHKTLQRVLGAEPDRLSIFNYAHLPERFKPQRRINAEELPAPDEKLSILQDTIEYLTEAGYVYIGMDHFARPDDELAIAQRSGTLYRNFQGYSTHSDCDLVAMGLTSISMVEDCYSQNVKTLDEYSACIDAGKLPVTRGIKLSEEDKLRRQIITDLICNFELDMAAVECESGIVFRRHFSREIRALRKMEEDGLLTIDKYAIRVQPRGRLLIRNICMVFDAYLPRESGQKYSKVI
jgi:oxygen-independent coproporphyrinogen-3 oxidase